MWGISYWTLPLISSVVWLAMLLTMLITWITDGSPHYSSMGDTQTIAYISDVGAQRLKPLFVSMSAITVVILDVALIAERWLRHTGRLVKNTSTLQKTLSILSIISAVAGAAGIILLAVFDTVHHPTLHNVFLAVFIVGYIFSAVFICWQYQRLGIHFREHSILRLSFWVKLVFILVEVALAVAFGVCQRQRKYNIAAIIEWIIALIFTFYVLSFFMDFIPAVRGKNHQSSETEVEAAMIEAESDPNTNGLHHNHHHHGSEAVNGSGRYYGPGAINGHQDRYTRQ